MWVYQELHFFIYLILLIAVNKIFPLYWKKWNSISLKIYDIDST